MLFMKCRKALQTAKDRFASKAVKMPCVMAMSWSTLDS